jgi:hypothetical protein
MVARFQESVEWFLRLEVSGSRVCDLVLGLMDGRAHMVASLEEDVGQLRVMQEEFQTLQSSATGSGTWC